VNQVADELLNDKKQLRDELQFFVMKSHVPNAYTTHNGIVVVTIGLLARLENESQLAVILAHEIQHFVLKHSLQQYKEVKQTIADSRSRRGNSDLESKIKHLYRFSKDQELEADKMGYELIKNSKYDLSEGIYVFEMLKYSDYPFLETVNN
jgi:predicted Zn-dependent protease